MLMWTNGVESSVFEEMMERTLKETIDGMQSFEGAKKLLLRNRLGGAFRLSDTFDRLSRLQLEPNQAGVRTKGLDKLLNGALYHIKVGLKHKARIPVPESYTLVGLVSNFSITPPAKQIDTSSKGVCLSPEVQSFTLEMHKSFGQLGHPLLVLLLKERRTTYLTVLYFLPEGLAQCQICWEEEILMAYVPWDLYNLIPLPELIPPHTYSPASYPPAKLKKTPGERDSTIDDIADFMVLYICNDALGAIAVNHLVIASSAELRARDENCMINAALHSKAVDFPMYSMNINPVTGMGMRPDWQAGHGRDPSDGQYYACDSVLGRLFRAVELPKGNPARESTDSPDVSKAIQLRVASHVAKYAAEIRATVDSTETETWIQALLSRSGSHARDKFGVFRLHGSSLIERMKRLTNSLTNYVRLELEGEEGGNHWIALDSVLTALNAINPDFLPNTGPLVPLFPTSTLTEAEQRNLDRFAPVDLDNWAWDDESNTEGSNQGGTEGAASASSHAQNRGSYPNGHGQHSRGGLQVGGSAAATLMGTETLTGDVGGEVEVGGNRHRVPTTVVHRQMEMALVDRLHRVDQAVLERLGLCNLETALDG
ncbi:RNA-dependent RNA polymerase [Ceratobasidium sp. AG-Ba]|nr:RNA-dependent RNA polymerase [Ceratobasidium sp. AG-Ba]